MTSTTDTTTTPEREGDGPPVAGVMLILAPIAVIVWVGIVLALMTAIDHYASLIWSVK